MQKLLQQVDVNGGNGEGCTALHVTKGTSMAKLLIDAGANPNLKNQDGRTPLHMWLEEGIFARNFSDERKYLELVTLLLKARASPNIQDNQGYNALHFLFLMSHTAAEFGIEASLIHKFITLLLRFNVDVNMPDFQRCTPLHHAVREPHACNAEVLIRSGAQIDARDFCGMTPLQLVFDSHNKEMIQLLLQNKADVNTQDLDGRTTLSTAVEVGNEVMVQLLLEDPRTCIDLADKKGVTPLHLAAFRYVDITEMLIRVSPNLNVRDLRNATPLHYAAYGGKPEIITLLLEAGADDKLIDNAGWRPRQYALSRHYYDTALRFGEEYLVDVTQSLPADYKFPMLVKASNVYSKEFGSSIVPHDLVEFLKEKSAGNISGYLQDMYTVAGVGQVPPNMAEVENVKQSIEEFMSTLAVEITKVDERFKGNLLRSGSVYEGTKIGDPDEFDYMLCLEELAQICLVTFNEDTKYNEVTIHKNMNETGVYEDFFDDEKLDSENFMKSFANVVRRALKRLADHAPVAREIYVEGVTADTLIHGMPITGTVTCKLKFKWAGLYYKQLEISVDLVPAIPVRHWPPIAREGSGLLTDDIKSCRCHLVPKYGYWRLSFSLAESLIMGGISWEQKSAFIGAKVVLHPVVSCKIVVCDDDLSVKKTYFPLNVLWTYFLKNLFFICIEENAKETNGRAVTTGQIFSKLIELFKESHAIPYFFIPNQDFQLSRHSLSDDNERDLIVLVATVINTLLNES